MNSETTLLVSYSTMIIKWYHYHLIVEVFKTQVFIQLIHFFIYFENKHYREEAIVFISKNVYC